jgi:hypothetical protein
MKYEEIIDTLDFGYIKSKHIFKFGDKIHEIETPYMPKEIFEAFVKSAIFDLQQASYDGVISDSEEVIEHLIELYYPLFKHIEHREGFSVTFDSVEDPTKCRINNEQITLRSEL